MYFVILALILGLAFRWPREFWFVLAICYLVSGPLMKLWSIAFPPPGGVAGFNPPEVPPSPETPPAGGSPPPHVIQRAAPCRTPRTPPAIASASSIR